MVVAIYCGPGKAPINEYLAQFVKELLSLLATGIKIGQFDLTVKIKGCICDTPARCYIKGIVGHNALEGCQKCLVTGDYRNSRMSFPRYDFDKRTDEQFGMREIPAHHRETSLIEKLQIDMIKDFVIADELHLIHLGLMKRCLSMWKGGEFGNLGHADKWFMVRTGDSYKIIEFEYALKQDDDYVLYGHHLKNLEFFFTEPISSSRIHVYTETIIRSDLEFYNIKDVAAKVICICCQTKKVF